MLDKPVHQRSQTSKVSAINIRDMIIHHIMFHHIMIRDMMIHDMMIHDMIIWAAASSAISLFFVIFNYICIYRRFVA